MILYEVLVGGCGVVLLFTLGCIRHAYHVPREWLKERIHVTTTGGECDETFGKLNPGDEIWHYSSPPERWKALAGRDGFALVRKACHWFMKCSPATPPTKPRCGTC